uniref:Rrf2 family transcriptional regulator n=1 Tax=candidate division WWE3 bacterium TaxID=2053526 RepID=A0A831YYV9_UNCKA
MPKFLTSRGDYGLLLMVYLAGNSDNGPRSISEIADSSHLPPQFLEQITLELRRAGLIKSKRGKEGGYFLARPPEMISIVEVLEALEGPVRTVTCQGMDCSVSPHCLTHDFWRAFQRHLHKTLQVITLADLLLESPHKLLPVAQVGRKESS